MTCVAFTGHRPNRIHIGAQRIEARLRAALRAVRKGCVPGTKAVALSALAEGSDRLFADAALGGGFELHAMLPFNSPDYETTFADPATTPVYRALLGRCVKTNVYHGSLTDQPAAYEEIGRTMATRCDILFAVWDAQPSAGRGGTPEIMQYALELGRPVVWIDAARDRPPLLLQAPSAGVRRHVALEKLAARAKGAAPRKLAALSSRGTRYPAG